MECPVCPKLDEEMAVAGIISRRDVFLHVTKACNLLCSYCYFAAHNPMPGEMSADEYRALWPALVALRPQKIIFTGGEPLLRPDILQLLRDLRAALTQPHTCMCCVYVRTKSLPIWGDILPLSSVTRAK